MTEDSNRYDRQRETGDTPSLSLAPMIDVVFLLLIFFMVSTTFVVRPGLDLSLPQSDHKVETAPDRWVVSIDPEGSIYLNRETISRDALLERLSEDPKPVSLRADRTVPHGLVVEVLNTVKEAGVESVNVSTEEPRDR
jgi:biopolymer transport protein ExbD